MLNTLTRPHLTAAQWSPVTRSSSTSSTSIESAPVDRFVASSSDDSAGIYSPRMLAQRNASGNASQGQLTTASLGSRGGTAMGSRIRPNYDEAVRTTGDAPLHPETRASRLADLDRISQLDRNEDEATSSYDEDRCGSASMVAGVYYANGVDGLRGLVRDMDTYRSRHHLDCESLNPEVRAHLASGNLTRDDINQIQDRLHGTLDTRQDDFLTSETGSNGAGGGIYSGVLDEFRTESPSVRRAFEDNGLSIHNVDTDGDGAANHFVLRGEHGGRPFVYDPWSIQGRDGNLDQVTQDPAIIGRYAAAADESW